MIPESFITELKYYSDIEQIVSSYVRLTRHGRTLGGLCPFHNEKTPSFTVYPDNQSFYCFGCGAGGDVITFMRRAENLDYVEAVRALAERAGIAMPDNAEDQASRRKTRILEINRAAARYYYDTLSAPAGARGLAYLRERALSDAAIRRFGLGYAPAGWDGLTGHLRSKGFTEEELLEARVAARGKSGKGCYDLFRDRVIFPIIDLRGGVVGFGGRLIEGNGPKYLNTPDTPVFRKSRFLFALNRAKASKLPGLVLAEGYMDVIALHQARFDNAVATLGTSLTDEQTRLIAKYAGEVIIAYDADGAGQNAARRAMNLFSEAGVKVRVLKLEGAKDPDEYIRKYGATRFKLLLEKSVGAMDFEIEKMRGRFDLETAEGKVGFLSDFVKLMAAIRNPLEREVYAVQVAGELAVSPKAVLDRVAAQRGRRAGAAEKKQQRDLRMYVGAGAVAAARADPDRERNLRYAVAEERMITLLLRNPDYYAYIAERIEPGQFVTRRNREIFLRLCSRLQNGLPVDMMSLSAVFDAEDMAYISGLCAGEVSLKQPPGEADDYIARILERGNEKDSRELGDMSQQEWARWAASSAPGLKPKGGAGR